MKFVPSRPPPRALLALVGVVGSKRGCTHGGHGGERRLLEAGLAYLQMMVSSSWCWQMPRHVKNVPGRKTDVNDAIWLADLLAARSDPGKLRAGLPKPRRCAICCARASNSFVSSRSHVQRVQKTFEDANIKLDVGALRFHGQKRPRHDRGYDRRRNQSRLNWPALAHPRASRRHHEANSARRFAAAIIKHHRFLLRLHLQSDRCSSTPLLPTLDHASGGERFEPFRTAVELITIDPRHQRISEPTSSSAEIGNRHEPVPF